ncbi:MAG: ATP-binding cassette domain-containing protein [Lachnospiraceae bacterium]
MRQDRILTEVSENVSTENETLKETPAIVVENLSKYYGEQKILDHLSFEIAPGDTVFVTGPSGIGKTTLLRIILGLEKGSSGVVKCNTERFSTVFQEDRLLEQFDITDNIRLVTNCTKEEVRKEFVKILPEDAFFKRVQEYSGGMKRRAAILRGLMSDSSAIFMDEPFKGLDEGSKLSTMAYVKEQKKNRILFIITHDMAEVDFFQPDKIIRLS